MGSHTGDSAWAQSRLSSFHQKMTTPPKHTVPQPDQTHTRMSHSQPEFQLVHIAGKKASGQPPAYEQHSASQGRVKLDMPARECAVACSCPITPEQLHACGIPQLGLTLGTRFQWMERPAREGWAGVCDAITSLRRVSCRSGRRGLPDKMESPSTVYNSLINRLLAPRTSACSVKHLLLDGI